MEAGSELVHYMYDGPFGSELPVMGRKGLRARGPRLLSNTPQTSLEREWKRCALQILDTRVRREHCTRPSAAHVVV